MVSTRYDKKRSKNSRNGGWGHAKDLHSVFVVGLVDIQLVFEVGDSCFQRVPLLQDALQLGQAEPGTMGVLLLSRGRGRVRRRLG